MTDDPITFRGGTPLLAVVIGVELVGVTASQGFRYALGPWPTLPAVDVDIVAVLSSLAILGAVWAITRHEGVRAVDLGLAPSLIVPATAAVAGFFVALNVTGAGLALASGAPGTIGYHWSVPPAEAVAFFVAMVVVAGLSEEFVFRGCVQTKCIAVLGGGRRTRVAAGIILASVLFSLSHVPRIVLDGAPVGTWTVEYLALLAVNGIVYGILYEGTYNLYVPVLVHAAGNMPGTAGILFFTTAGWPTWAIVGYHLAYLAALAALILGYRRWAVATDRMPVWTERSAGSPRRADTSA